MANEHYWIKCPRCDGAGVILVEQCAGWTDDDIQADPDGFEEMMRSAYNVPCPLCQRVRMVQKGGPEHVRFLQGAPYAEVTEPPFDYRHVNVQPSERDY